MFKYIFIFIFYICFALVFTVRTRAIVFGIDGFLTRCLNARLYPGFQWLIDHGSYTFKARTAINSVSGPGWSNILCAMSSEETGIRDNAWFAPWLYKKPQPVTPLTGNDNPLPCIFQTIKSNNQNLKTAAFFNWNWFLNFGNSSIPNSIDKEYYCRNNNFYEAVDCDLKALNKTVELIISGDFDYYYIHFHSLDTAGHTFNFCSNKYVSVIATLDMHLQGVIQALINSKIYNSTYLLVTSDHGASDQTSYHGAFKDNDNLFVPWMIVGPNVKQGYKIKGNIKNADTSPTILHALGLQQNPIWRAKPVLEIFEISKEIMFLN